MKNLKRFIKIFQKNLKKGFSNQISSKNEKNNGLEDFETMNPILINHSISHLYEKIDSIENKIKLLQENSYIIAENQKTEEKILLKIKNEKDGFYSIIFSIIIIFVSGILTGYAILKII
jgi:hypothetical protein